MIQKAGVCFECALQCACSRCDMASQVACLQKGRVNVGHKRVISHVSDYLIRSVWLMLESVCIQQSHKWGQKGVEVVVQVTRHVDYLYTLAVSHRMVNYRAYLRSTRQSTHLARFLLGSVDLMALLPAATEVSALQLSEYAKSGAVQ